MHALAEFASDLRFAVRTTRKAPLASATIVLCLGFSIGTTGMVFAWMDAILFQPLPRVAGVARLSSLKAVARDGSHDGLSYPDFRDVRAALTGGGSPAFTDLTVFSIRRFNLRTDTAADARMAEPVWAALTGSSYFDLLGIRPAAGRAFTAADAAAPGGAAVAVISHALWQRRFGGDRGVLGRRLRLNDREFEIVGITPPGFYGNISRVAFDVWAPITMLGDVGGPESAFEDRDMRWLNVFGRLAPGVTLEEGRAAAATAGARLSATYEADRDYTLTATTLDVGPIDRMATLSTVLFGTSVLVVLIVCSNVANLLLQRGAAREHEIAVRLALGASPARVVRQLMTENLLLAVGGVGAGAAVFAWAGRSMGRLVPSSPLPIVVDTPFDTRVVIFIAAIGVATVFLFGLAPALRASGVSVRESLGSGATRGGSRGSGILRGVLVSAQFALSLAVLVIAGLFLSRLGELQHVDRGFRHPEQVVLSTIDFTMSGVTGDAAHRTLTERLVGEVARLPGVRSAAAASFVPLGFIGYSSYTVDVDGYVPRAGEPLQILGNRVTAGYFTTMDVPMVRGRPIDVTDREDARDVAVVNETFARRFWGDRDPIGRALRIDGRALTVVGVAADGKYEYLAPLDAPSPPFLYLPFAQWPSWQIFLHARAAGDPMALVPPIARAVTAVDSRLTSMSPSTLDEYSSVPFMPITIGSVVLTALGGAALALAAVGLYAVIAYAVAQQRREIGIRMALGATPRHIVARVLGQAARYTTAGAVAGAALAASLAGVLASRAPGILPHVGADRAWSFAAASAALGAVAAVASVIPAMRASRVSPTSALRDE